MQLLVANELPASGCILTLSCEASSGWGLSRMNRNNVELMTEGNNREVHVLLCNVLISVYPFKLFP
jgi:hypothetical protein